MALTKKVIARSIQQGTGASLNQACQLVETTLGIIKTTLATGEDVLVSGFGRFRVREKNARKGRNPATGEDMMLKPRKVVTFTCSGKMKERLNGSK
jgi:integration host factor subunit alpha